MNQAQFVTNILIRRRFGRVGLRRKVPGTNPLLKPKVFSQSSEIQRPSSPSQEPQISSTHGSIHPISVKRIQIIKQMNHRWRIQTRSKVKSREGTK